MDSSTSAPSGRNLPSEAGRSPTLSLASASAYLFQEFGGTASKALLQRSAVDNLDYLLRLALQARDFSAEEQRERIEAALEAIDSCTQDGKDILVSEPVAYHWVSIARMCVNEAAGDGRDPVLDDYEREFGLGPEEFRSKHFGDFARLGLGAAALNVHHSSTPAGLRGSVAEPFSWVVPGMRIVLIPPDHETSLPQLSTSALGQLAARSGELSLGAGRATWKIERQFGGTAQVPFVIDTQDACMRLAFVESYPRVDDRDELRRFESTLGTVIELIHSFNPALASEMPLFIRRVCPMHTAHRAAVSSGSVSSLFGAVFLSYLDDPFFVAEMLIHEFGHTKLRLLDNAHKFLEGDDVTAFYSPWRNEPRPLDGLMHGLYVFSLVTRFWLWVHETAATRERVVLAERRVRTLVPQLEYALEEFENHATCTPSGKVFLEVVRTEVFGLRGLMPGTEDPSVKPFFVGPVRDQELLTMSAEASVRRHRDLFFERFRRGTRA